MAHVKNKIELTRSCSHKFYYSITTLRWYKTLWLDVPSNLTFLTNQRQLFQHDLVTRYSVIKFVYSIDHRAISKPQRKKTLTPKHTLIAFLASTIFHFCLYFMILNSVSEFWMKRTLMAIFKKEYILRRYMKPLI